MVGFKKVLRLTDRPMTQSGVRTPTDKGQHRGCEHCICWAKRTIADLRTDTKPMCTIDLILVTTGQPVVLNANDAVQQGAGPPCLSAHPGHALTLT